MAKIPLDRQIACVEREINIRRLLYPRWVVQRRMPQEQCDYEIDAMEAVLETMKGLVAGVVLKGLAAELEPAAAGGQQSLF